MGRGSNSSAIRPMTTALNRLNQAFVHATRDGRLTAAETRAIRRLGETESRAIERSVLRLEHLASAIAKTWESGKRSAADLEVLLGRADRIPELRVGVGHIRRKLGQATRNGSALSFRQALELFT